MSGKYLHFRVPLVGYCRIIQRTFRYYQLNYKLINVMNQQFFKKNMIWKILSYSFKQSNSLSNQN